MIASTKNYTVPENYPFKEQNNVQYKDIQYEETITYIQVNSSDRNTSKHPNVNKYKIELDVALRNVKSIEIVSCSLANQGTPLANPYFILSLEGLDHISFANSSNNKGFCSLYLSETAAPHILPDICLSGGNEHIFKTPVATLSNLDISIYKPDGTLFSFGEPSADTTIAYSNSFLFRVKTIEKSRKDLNHRAVFF